MVKAGIELAEKSVEQVNPSIVLVKTGVVKNGVDLVKTGSIEN